MGINIDIADLIKDQISNIIWAVIGLLGIGALAFARFISTRVRWLAESLTWRIVIAQLITIGIAAIGLNFFRFEYAGAFAIAALFAIPVWVTRDFRRMGLASAFTRTSSGIGFATSLKLARRNFSFLGIGANKLISESSFEDTMSRCATDGKVARFLISHPDNPSLERMARRNSVDPAIYKRRVQNSIDALRDLRDNRRLNIEIRLYRHETDADYQRFRLVFIDEEICLLGWTVWGAHEGRENPQVILTNKRSSASENQTVYKAFFDYYEALWSSADPVN